MKKPEEGAEGWQLTYNSLMLIMLTFMAVLCAMSTVSSEHLKLALGSIRELMGVAPEELTRIEEERKKVMESIEKVEEYPDIEARVTTEGIILDIKSPIFFKKGIAELKSGAYPVLKQVVELAEEVNPHEIEVGGFTCDLPIDTKQFASNWELSLARAISVVKALKSELLPDMNILATGNGEYKPKVPNTSEANRKLNRRVEIYLRYGKKR